MEEKIKVYIKININNEVTNIQSATFLNDLYGWIYLDEGYGDKYAHAQSHYFEKPLTDQFGNYNYRFQNGKIISNTY